LENIDIVIVCYNCGADIVSVLEDIRRGDYPLEKIRFLIVDNASADDSLLLLREVKNLNVEIIASPKNLGFGAGCNLARRFLAAPKTLFLNPDVHLYKDSIKNLLTFSVDNPKALIWGGRTLDSDGKDDGKGAWREPTLRGVLAWAFFLDLLTKKIGLPSTDAYQFNSTTPFIRADAISGCFFLIDTSVFNRLNGFDERFFMYSEEIDLCRRARDIGAAPVSTNAARIVHHGSKTLNSISKLNLLYYHKLKYFQKHWSIQKFKFAQKAIFLGTLFRVVAYSTTAFFMPSKKPRKELWLNFLKIQNDWRF